MRGRVFGKYYEGHMGKTGVGEMEASGEVDLAEGVVGGKCRQQ